MTVRILLTGSPGSGKTTAAARTARALRIAGVPVEGFLTQEVRQEGRGKDRRIGFDLVPFRGKRRVLARIGLEGEARVGRYGVDVGAVDAVSKETRDRLQGLPGDAVVIVDEVGRMELFSKGFIDLVDAVLSGPWPCLLTVTKARVPQARALLDRRDVEVFDLDEVDREALPGRLGDAFVLPRRPPG